MAFLDNSGVSKLVAYFETKIQTLLAQKQAKLTEGTGIDIKGDTIRVLLNDTTSSTSRTQAATANSVYETYRKASELLFKVTRYTYTYSVSANGSTNVTKNQLGISVPTGYTMGGYVAVSTGHANIVPRSWNPQSTATGTSIVLRNLSSTAVSNQTLIVDVLWLKSDRTGS